jgi:ABC-type multidrug transport system fused ATPase/permease subunit
MLGRAGSDRLAPWVVVSAIAITVLVLGTVVFAVRSDRERVYQEYATAKAYDEARGKFNEECSDIASIKDLWQCFERIIETAREPQRSEEDLRAQKEMAQWSYWMVIISAFVGVPSIGIAWAALYWIVQTWALQRRAAEAAIKAVKITEETAKRQLRAYVGTSRVYIRDFRRLVVLQSRPRFEELFG